MSRRELKTAKKGNKVRSIPKGWRKNIFSCNGLAFELDEKGQTICRGTVAHSQNNIPEMHQDAQESPSGDIDQGIILPAEEPKLKLFPRNRKKAVRKCKSNAKS